MAEVKLKDIAQAAGVSTVTVSNAFSGKRGVSNDVREKIEEIARNMGYDFSRYEKKEGGYRIGVIASEMYMEMGTSFYWAMYQQVVYAASKSRSQTMLEILDTDMQRRDELPKLMREKMIDGLIVIGWHFKSYVENLVKKSEIPIVLLDFQIKGLKCDAVMSGNYIGMYKMTHYLLEKGHRDIAFVGSVYANENIMDRYYGYRKGLEEAGIPFRKEWVLEDRDLIVGDMRVELPDNMPTAFVCNSDLSAGYLYDALTEKGFRIPEDISIVGYDNYLFGHSFADRLTTYNVDIKRMGAIAVKLLMGKIRGDEKHWGTRYVDSVIVERDSVKELRW